MSGGNQREGGVHYEEMIAEIRRRILSKKPATFLQIIL
jgi:hypothetical protein